ncbi:MAG: pyridoxal phosphate-dependent aminotransferase [Polyangiaceae bacterium]|nr:pyridoxal phosphate-dependent aminotransferase [Polyangiaceae bacterium]
MRFSKRASWDLSVSDVADATRRARDAHADPIDLTESNPTRVGLASIAGLPALLARDEADRYDPDPCGMLGAREAVAAYYAERGYAVDPSRVILSASTSEAYAWLFKLLCDDGDEVLVPTPSYPLFSYLAGLEGARVETYPLVRADGFRVDTSELARKARSPRARAVVVVAPNNPTGTLLHEEDARAVEAIAAEHGLALIVDEVFSDYVWSPSPHLRRSFVGASTCATFVLSGLSKVCCAPGLKLGWMVSSGPDALVREAAARLEVIADTFLSVATPVQIALPDILARRSAIQAEVRARIETNRAELARAVGASSSKSVRVVPSDGGWTSLVEVPRVMGEDAWVTLLAERDGVLVQPGFFFDLDDGGTLAVSLIVEPDRFRRGVASLVARVDAVLAG